MAGLLGGVLPAIYSGADQLKRQVYGLLTNPMEMAERAGQSLLQAHNERQALMRQAHGDPTNPLKITDKDAFNALTSQVMAGELGFAPMGITAWHGSPHKFDKFDLTKVGTGEGAQAYGHGMYFAEAPNVAKTYATDISKAQTGLKVGNKALQFVENPQTATEKAHNYLIENARIAKVENPNMSAMDVLHQSWGAAPNNEIKQELGDDLNILFGKDITPAQFLNTWEIIHPTGGVGIGEKLLNEQGVKGIRYLDQNSRTAPLPDIEYYKNGVKKLTEIYKKEPTESNKFALDDAMQKLESVEKGLKDITSNFVIFDPSSVKILERNNQPVESLLGN